MFAQFSDCQFVIKRTTVLKHSSTSFFPPEESVFGTFTLGSLNFRREVQMVVFHVFFLIKEESDNGPHLFVYVHSSSS